MSNVIPSMNHLKQTPRFKQVDNCNYNNNNNNKPCSARHNNDMRCNEWNDNNKAMTPNKIILPKINKRKYRSSNTTNHTAPYMNVNDDNDNNNAMHYIINNIHELKTNHLYKKKQFHNGGGGRGCNSYHNIFHASNNNNQVNNNIIPNNININESLIYQIKPPNNC